MGLQFRKLLSDYYNETSPPISGTFWSLCQEACDSSDDEDYCQTEICFDYCNNYCPFKLPPTPSVRHAKPSKFLITGLVLASVFFLVFCYAIYFKFYSGSRRRRSESEEQRNEIHQDFLDEDHGPVVDHPIWYINTVGLQPSVINSIGVCKYKRGDGLVEGTDCSVCLSEFQEDETLRLLPKCSHAFHIPCIDTWLRSHTNCPLCRAPVIATPARASSSEGNGESSSAGEEAQMEVSEIIENGDGELSIETEEEEEEEEEEFQDENRRKRVEEVIQPMRRSVSLDSLSAFKISQALANVGEIESDRISGNLAKESESNMGIVSKRVYSNQGLLKFMGSSSIGKSLQIGPSSLKRSLSCGGKLFLLRYSKNRNSVLPL